MPIRKIPIQTKSVAGKFFSYKNKKLVNFESQLEKKCFLILEFDDSVVSYQEQPLKIDNYIPDILAFRENNKPLLFEVKYSNEFNKENEKLHKKIETLQKFANSNDMEFKIFTEKDIKEPYFSNISFIYNYANIKINNSIKKNIISIIPLNGISINNLLEKLNYQYEYLKYIYHLIFVKKLKTNLHIKLTKNSIIRKNYD